MILMRPLKALNILILLCFSTLTIDCFQQSANLRNNISSATTATKFYELKFQNELDNSTIVKQEFQQQIFKCQVRLAPVSPQSSSASHVAARPRFKSSLMFMPMQTNQSSTQQHLPPTPVIRPSNWNLTIDWLKDDQSIGSSSDAGPEAIAVINVELKSNNTSNNGLPKNDKRNISKTRRIEIKNTLNGNQMKLTSRLRLTQLRGSDSGQYKCIARASFQIPGNDQSGLGGLVQGQSSGDGPFSASSQPTSSQSMVIQMEQTLESNGQNLIVTNATDGGRGEQEGGTKEPVGGGASESASGSQKALPLPNGRQQQQLFQRGTTRQNNLASSHPWQDIHQLKNNANDTQHATKALASEDHLEGGGQTTTTSAEGGSPLGSNGSAAEAGAAVAAATTKVQQPAARNELGGRDNNEHSSGSSRTSSGRSSSNQRQHKQVNQFEDDEDLFKMEQERIEFINGQRRGQTTKFGGAAAAAGSPNDDEDEAQRRAQRQQQHKQHDRHQSTAVQANDVSIMVDEWAGAANNEDDQLDSNNESSLASSNNQQDRNDRSPVIISMKEDMSFMGSIGFSETTNYAGPTIGSASGSGSGSGAIGDLQNPPSVFTMDHYLTGSLDSTRMRLVKLVHRIAPELSCYTGMGEHYLGKVSVSADKRPCMSWPLIRSSGFEAAALEAAKGHNHCRNPNWDPRGPWCFVQYIETLDGHYEAGNPISGALRKGDNNSGNNSNNNNNNNNTSENNNLMSNGTRYVPRPCSISPCSEYLWLYIVAPPLGLLVLLSCLVTILVRSIRNSHYRAIISMKRHTMPKFNRLLTTRPKFGGRKFGGARKKCGNSYLDEDIFEIVDDLDWSDGQTQSLSPNTESLKLDSSFSSASPTNDAAESRLSGCKSSNPIFCNDRTIDRTSTTDLLGGGDACDKSVSQVGPLFATLRCHIRANPEKLSHGNQSTASRPLFRNKPRGLIEQCDLAYGGNGRLTSDRHKNHNAGDWVANQSDSSSSSSDCNRAIQSQHSTHRQQTNGGHLISCSTTTSSIADSGCLDSSMDCATNTNICAGSGKYIKGSELVQLNASSICLTAEEQQPIFEGKFSQVLLAHIKRHEINGKAPAGATLASGDMSPPSSGLHQVAICSLKPGAAIDPSTLKPSNLKLHNLNHLNLLKLIGYARIDGNEIGLKNSNNHCQPTHMLIYDMEQLIDLSDWLKRQNEDMITTNEPGNDLMIRRNLTCFAKQLALAIDYLHDQGIIYKDLACRNCFLDPTKMLVKLASFNIELANDSTRMEGEATSATMKAQNLGSMIRPKYLLDYYVIESRPADCQLLPLSWIPLESILFNKFNKQTDVWSFGCLLYELFSLGKVAYFGYSSKQIIDAVRSNLMPPQPLLCPNGIYKLMCKCLSDIPSIRPNVKQIYEQLNLFSGQCSSFLDHHLCSLATTMYDDQLQQKIQSNGGQLIELKSAQSRSANEQGNANNNNSITKTKSYANIRNLNPSSNRSQEISLADYNNPRLVFVQDTKPEGGKIPLSKSINLAGPGGGRFTGGFSFGNAHASNQDHDNINHYDELVVVNVKKFVGQDL